MARFRFSRSGKSDQITPVSFDRIMHTLSDMGYTIERETERPVASTSFNGYPVRFHADEETNFMYFTVNVSAGPVLENEVGRNTWETAFAWANQWNKDTYFGTASVLGDTPEDYFLIVDVSIPCQAGMTDQQLKRWIDVALSATLQACDAYHEPDKQD